MLYLVPTPIGNLEDITLRALRILKEVNLILAEDTRHSGILLKRYDIETKMIPYHQHNEHQLTASIVERLMSGETMALISDAGTPGISDAGFLLVRECRKQQIPVSCLPGATAFVPALVQSGFPTDQFRFCGFLPQKKGRQTKWKELASETGTLVLYESPNRLTGVLEEIRTWLGASVMVHISRELTKMHEENITGNVNTLMEHFSKKTVMGEIVVVIDCRTKTTES